MGDNLVYSVRGSTGLFIERGLNKPTKIYEKNHSTKDVSCDVFQYSNNGQYFAFCDRQVTRVIELATCKEILSVELKRTKRFVFSPRDNLILTFEQYTIYGQKTSADQKPEPNVRVFSLPDGKHLHTMISQKEATWEPQWTEDETIAARMVGGEFFFYANNCFEKHERRLVVAGANGFSLSPSTPAHIAIYVSASGSEPARLKVHRVNDDFTLVANRVFFKSDRATMTWNQKGTALLIMTSVEVDSSNQSYYGEQSLYLVNVQTDESVLVPLGKKGPVYAAKWNPNGREFAACYGYMPAKVTLYNMKGAPTFDTLEGPRNDLYYNAFGNILLICGFGNLSKGKMEFWDVEKKKEIISIEVPNTTLFEWAPDGQHFMTATTAPRLRIDNCYRLWHYSGRMLNEVDLSSPAQELWEVKWRPMTGYNKFEVRELTKNDKMAAGLPIKKKDASHPLNNVPAGAVKQQGAYVPPHLRKGGATASNGLSATAVKPLQSELEKKTLNLKKKLEDINKLKDRVARGDQLQVNQLDKIKKEQEFLDELKALTISS